MRPHMLTIGEASLLFDFPLIFGLHKQAAGRPGTIFGNMMLGVWPLLFFGQNPSGTCDHFQFSTFWNAQKPWHAVFFWKSETWRWLAQGSVVQTLAANVFGLFKLWKHVACHSQSGM